MNGSQEQLRTLNAVSVTDDAGRRRSRRVKEGFYLKPPMSKHGVLTGNEIKPGSH